jgi:hypothetical protein
MPDKITLIVRFKLQETAKTELVGQLKELFDQIEREEAAPRSSRSMSSEPMCGCTLSAMRCSHAKSSPPPPTIATR